MQQQDSAYLLHIKPYKESSALIRLFTAKHGLLSGILKGVYKKDKRAAAYRATLQIGNCMDVAWVGRGDLKTFIQFDTDTRFPPVNTQIFLCLSYVNELLLVFMQEALPLEEAYWRYQQLLKNLAVSEDLPQRLLEASLRAYEFDLLEVLGFDLDFSHDAQSGSPVNIHSMYQVIAGVGVQRVMHDDQYAFRGKTLLDIVTRDFSDTLSLKQAKKLSRYLLHYHLDGRPLKTRQFYRDMA